MKLSRILDKPQIFLLVVSLIFVACGGKESFDQFEHLSSQSSAIPSGSIIITSNSNGTTGPGIISIWTPAGTLDRVIYDYTKVSVGYASGISVLDNGKFMAVTDSGGGASNDSLDLFDYATPFANPISLFSTLSSGAATTYMRNMATVKSTSTNRYYSFISESGNNRVTRLSSPVSTTASGFNFTRDFNFAANGSCTLATPYGVSYIPSSGNIAIISSAASGRVNIYDVNGICVGSTAMTNTPTASAYHSLGDKILVTYAGNSSISAHDVTTGAANPATAIYTSAGQLSTPRAIATDSKGFIYVGSDGLDQVVKLYWDGVSASATYVGVIVGSSVFTQNITSITVVP